MSDQLIATSPIIDGGLPSRQLMDNRQPPPGLTVGFNVSTNSMSRARIMFNRSRKALAAASLPEVSGYVGSSAALEDRGVIPVLQTTVVPAVTWRASIAFQTRMSEKPSICRPSAVTRLSSMTASAGCVGCLCLIADGYPHKPELSRVAAWSG
jgi:hypothetical protein